MTGLPRPGAVPTATVALTGSGLLCRACQFLSLTGQSGRLPAMEGLLLMTPAVSFEVNALKKGAATVVMTADKAPVSCMDSFVSAKMRFLAKGAPTVRVRADKGPVSAMPALVAL